MTKAPPVGATLHALTELAPWRGCAPAGDAAYRGFAQISLAGDKVTRVLYEVKPRCMGGGSATILWSSPTGNTVLGTVGYTDGPSMTEHREVVLVSQGKATLLTWPGAVTLLSSDRVAF